MKIDVILPAGGRIEGSFAAESGTPIKALLEVGGQSILERTISALHATGRIGKIVVIGSTELGSHPATALADIVLPEAESGPANIFNGLEWLKQHQPGDQSQRSARVLILTTDLPFLTPEIITNFLDICPEEADVCVPIIEKTEFEACFPDAPNFYVPLRDGHWTLGCAFLLDPQYILRNRTPIEQVFEARKSQFKMAKLLGPLFILRLLTRRLTVEHISVQCEQILGCKGAVVLGGAPELAYDIDLPEEYRYALGWKQ